MLVITHQERLPGLHVSRRGFLIAGSLALTSGSARPGTPACTLTSEQEQGPYYVKDAFLRRDITEGRDGVPLILTVNLVDAKSCSPLKDAALDIWHCDALGVYSGFMANSPNGGPGRGGPPPGAGGMRPGPMDPSRFLRGVQVSDQLGSVEFATLYPGWYYGRAIHIHIKVHAGGAAAKTYSGGHVAHTGQLFFPEDLTERVAQLQPYAKRLEVHRTTQSEDGIFKSQHGAGSMVAVEKLGRAEKDGIRARVTLAVDTEATPAPVGRAGPPRQG